MTIKTSDKVSSEKFVYGVVTRSENRLEERIEKMEGKMEKRFDKAMTHLVKIAGQFKKFDEERVVLAERQKEHTDKIEKLERTVFKTS